ncbi:hypothetical protein CcaverHIS002_0304700 [Cutaneotrichosporon cavernicola]|uniref:Subtelomeric hrmA-associated cluster protein AFUB-079030/YDR124W-like helical bundle domain-containing protein n=1 Tax=Cutaneotrichosporon cavernicola TaxID=279322 RepID=A0AA48L0V1_9TREE|nr:uncharacterized protein CcaverHIS019_0304660 [Cutaneotrichosporon cavernicola]BEI82602.1 hypothetical protein CcaverHIS002_0304700 [Cutaneotrichosporon cavernicola]BEI90396.1 hypothetical protein CcaverHIS019_0304660 [Cutaneotrichosporon cavernicola]BEI98172.1 hypothetical protein CcaverHIS631_0304710 [Cutaneotrichosporon cavernicola]BEJ05949.1 hypothetical protein CcaverHIS641_0304710 [Cutaneotrichosporon cavernicola]
MSVFVFECVLGVQPSAYSSKKRSRCWHLTAPPKPTTVTPFNTFTPSFVRSSFSVSLPTNPFFSSPRPPFLLFFPPNSSKSKMPRIPSREEPYHSVAKCNRHWKTKREFVTKAANKASHVDGSHYLLVCVTPKGNIEVHASEHFFDDASQTRLDGVINWEVLRRRATTIQSKNEERWSEIERQEKRFGVEGEDGEDEAADDDDVASSKGARSHRGSTVDFDPSLMDATGVDVAAAQGRHTPAPGQHVFSAAKASPLRPIAALTINPMMLESVYVDRFTNLGQTVCANILKAWIKVVEPKKQTKYPYKNKRGDEGKAPPWWPVGMRHIEPDHLHKEERPRLLASIIQQASRPRAEGSAAIAAATAPDLRELTISRLHFATAEISSSIPPRQHYELRQIYLIAKEVRKANEDKVREQRARGIKIEDRNAHLWTEMTVEFFEKPPVGGVHPAAKRSYDATGMGLAFEPMADNKENVDFERHIKRGKHMSSPLNDLHHQHVATPLAAHHNVYAVPSYGIEPHTPHTPYGGGWTVAPISIPPVQAATPTSAPPTAHLVSGGHQAQQQQAYYRAAMATEISHSYPASNASYTPPQSQQTLHSTSAPGPASAGTTPAYGSTQSYSYHLNYSSSTPATSATLYTAGSTPPGYGAYGPYEQQAFVNDIAGLSA